MKNYSPAVATLLPLFYIAWADSVLGPSEIALLEAKIHDLSWLEEPDKELLSSWMNPQNPPSDELIAEWAAQIQKAAEKIPLGKRLNLGNLALAMAKTQKQGENDADWLDADDLKALESLEKLLNIENIEEHRALFSEAHRAESLKAKRANYRVAPEKIQALLDDDYAEIRSRVFHVLRDPMFQYQTLRGKEDYREQVYEWLKLLADQGLGSLHFPEAYGGKNNMGAYSAVFETLGYHDLSLAVKFGVQFGLFGGSVLNLGTDWHHNKYLAEIGMLQLPGCFAMTETGHGSNVRDLETTATYDPATDELVIHTPSIMAGKDYIGNAACHAQMASVFAQLIVNGENHGVHAILVPIRDKEGKLMPEVCIEDCAYKLGLNGVDNGRIYFNHVRVPRQNLLNRFGNIDEKGNYSSPIENPSKRFFTMLGTLVGGRVCVPRAGLSASKTALTIAIRYALKRRQFGPEGGEEQLIMDYPSHQRRLMPHLAKAYALDIALTHLTKRFTDAKEEDMRELETLAAALKAYGTWHTTQCIQDCREACGGKGYLAENRFADLKADTDIFSTFEGDNTVLMQLAAKGVLQDFKKELSGGLFDVLGFVAERFMTTVREKNPIHIRNTDEGHLLSSSFQLDAFRYRERDLTVSVAGRLRKDIGRGIDGYQAFLRCQTHMLELGHAFAERVVLEQFVEQEKKCEDPQLLLLMQRLRSLYALHCMETQRGWFLEQNYIEASKSKAIRKLVDKLAAQVREDAALLVDAFGIPDDCLGAPIGVSN